MCGCKQGTCPGNCACGCRHTPPPPPRPAPLPNPVQQDRPRATRRAKLFVLRLVGSLLPARIITVQDECWCGTHHLGDYWHDPTWGKVDRDIQDAVNANFAEGTTRSERFIIMLNAQTRRDQGRPI